MVEKAIKMLAKKHLFIVGASESDRHKFISEIIEQTHYETFRFPKGMKLVEDYVEFVRKKKLFTPWYAKKGRFNFAQSLDFHRDWISEDCSLVILEEFQDMEESWKLDLLGSYIFEIENRKKGVKVVHLIVSQESENDLIDKLSDEVSVRENERRTKRQIVEGSFEVVEL